MTAVPPTWQGLARIVSGGQTGVDRGALDAARALGLPHGGWCPRGRRAEDGAIPPEYALREHDSPEYHRRTEQNVIDSDGTLILARGPLTGGTALTLRFARAHRRPWHVVDCSQLVRASGGEPVLAAARRESLLPTLPWSEAIQAAAAWIAEAKLSTLNVAGPRESLCPGIGLVAMEFIRDVAGQVPRRPGA